MVVAPFKYCIIETHKTKTTHRGNTNIFRRKTFQWNNCCSTIGSTFGVSIRQTNDAHKRTTPIEYQPLLPHQPDGVSPEQMHTCCWNWASRGTVAAAVALYRYTIMVNSCPVDMPRFGVLCVAERWINWYTPGCVSDSGCTVGHKPNHDDKTDSQIVLDISTKCSNSDSRLSDP